MDGACRPSALDAVAAPGYWSGMEQAGNSIFSGEAVGCVRGARRVFAGLDFRLRAGDALVLTGPNGSGKSSLLRLMAGLSAPACGTIRWNGEDIGADRQSHGGRAHYVGHATGVKPALEAAEDLEFWSAFRLRSDREAQRRALARFGLVDRARFPVRFLSSGQRRRLALARLIAAPAPLWLLDEPTVGLDRAGQDALEAAIAEHRGDGGIVVLASHVPVALEGSESELDLAGYGATRADIPEDIWAEAEA